MKILYIEDNPVDIDLTLRRLKKDAPDMAVDTAKSQAEALNIIRSQEFSEYDLVLTDMHLQDGDGIAILSHIRGHSLPVAVVILTGQGDEAAAVAALKAGADDYVIKKRGYLDGLQTVLDNALTSYQLAKDKTLQALHVLYVEHNMVDVDLTRRHFDRYAPHIRIDILHRVSDFYEILEQKDRLAKYSVLLLDYRLPQENGLEIMRSVLLTSSKQIPVILITGKGDEEIAVKALKLGAFDYITKNRGYLFKLPSVIENAYYSKRLSREHEALLESEKRYRSLFENNRVVTLLVDEANGDIIDANSAAVNFYGWSHELLTAMNLSAIESRPEPQIHDKVKIIATEDQGICHFFHRKADGSVCDVEVYSSPVEIGGKTLLYSMIYDITERIANEKEREKLLRQLVQSQKMEAFGQLAGGIAHDFNNILSAVIGYTELAIDQVGDDSPVAEDLQEIYTAGKRAKDLVQQILAFARQTGDEIGPVCVGDVAGEVLRLIRSSTPATVEIVKNVQSDSVISGNAIHIHQIIMNLCSNAVHAMEEGGLLEITLQDVDKDETPEIAELDLRPGRYVELSIKDTGTGIPEEIQDVIYEPYFTTKPPGEGTGMGLPMVHGIVKSYGGHIHLTSMVGKGSHFKIYLPVYSGVPETRLYTSSDLPGGTERILLVDDEEPIAKMQGLILERLGYSVTVMTDSQETLRLFSQKPHDFDLVLTDTNMPQLPGDRLAGELMNIRPDIPVILCTGYAKKLTDETAKKIGIKAFSYKPIVSEQLAKIVRSVLDEAKSSAQM